MTPEQLVEIRAHHEAAIEKLRALCEGRERWVMRIPAQLTDPDLVLSASLHDIPALLDYIEELRAALLSADSMLTLARYRHRSAFDADEIVFSMTRFAL